MNLNFTNLCLSVVGIPRLWFNNFVDTIFNGVGISIMLIVYGIECIFAKNHTVENASKQIIKPVLP